jgi:hypothetical protein
MTKKEKHEKTQHLYHLCWLYRKLGYPAIAKEILNIEKELGIPEKVKKLKRLYFWQRKLGYKSIAKEIMKLEKELRIS